MYSRPVYVRKNIRSPYTYIITNTIVLLTKWKNSSGKLFAQSPVEKILRRFAITIHILFSAHVFNKHSAAVILANFNDPPQTQRNKRTCAHFSRVFNSTDCARFGSRPSDAWDLPRIYYGFARFKTEILHLFLFVFFFSHTFKNFVTFIWKRVNINRTENINVRNNVA